MELAPSICDSPHAPCVTTAEEDMYTMSPVEGPGLLPLFFASHPVIHSDSPNHTSPMSSPGRSVPSDTLSLKVGTPNDETLWNLIPYNVPWSHEYFTYGVGIFPRPEGHCLFLRSPTPVERKRTLEACPRCREVKKKVYITSFSCCWAAHPEVWYSAPETVRLVYVALKKSSAVDMYLNRGALHQSMHHAINTDGNHRRILMSPPQRRLLISEFFNRMSQAWYKKHQTTALLSC